MPDRGQSTARPLAFPPTVDPKQWEDFPVFRETFLSLIAPVDINAGFRSFAAALHSIVLESHGQPVLPLLPGEQVRHDLAAVAADLRHLQGFMLMVGEVCEGGQRRDAAPRPVRRAGGGAAGEDGGQDRRGARVKPLRTATFTVHGTTLQSARWKQASEAEGFTSVGQWLAGAADAYLRIRARAGQPVPLAWRLGYFKVQLETGEELVRGHLSPPFASFRGGTNGPAPPGFNVHSLVYAPTGRILATVRRYQEARALASELARQWLRGDGSEPESPWGRLVEERRREPNNATG